MPKKIILIACASKKLARPSKAKDLYISPLFKGSLAYAYRQNPDKIFVLSALHHLLDLEKEIEPYNVTLSNIPQKKRTVDLKILNGREKNEWGNTVINQLAQVADLQNDEFIILAGKAYIKPIAPAISHLTDPLARLRQGERLSFLNASAR